ncbi:hypothetical protein GWI33_013669 [Rhynchophorus ferrugineus]|uniref:Uncharacterized protein n=1 Tax=Rhynchophorus ferrugineus TaxID=354439 RepID=A0A834I907_RHYFE|nr:hypothetical protein GWI33_013669 [Rhynchophorus ferrugineus]
MFAWDVVYFYALPYFIFVSLTTSCGLVKSRHRYKNAELLQHYGRREILPDTKTIYLPEQVVYAEYEPQAEIERKSRSRDCVDLKRRRNTDTLNSLDFEEYQKPCKVNTELNNISRLIDDIRSNKESISYGKENSDKDNIMIVKINISSTNYHEYDAPSHEEEIFWHNTKSEREIRTLQSKIMQKYMNPSINPCVDFYTYACGNWKLYHTIPPDRSSYDTFEIIRENLDLVLNKTLSDKSDIPPNNDQLKKITFSNFFATDVTPNITTDAIVKAKYFYESCMREDVIFNRGSEPLHKILKELGGWPVLHDQWIGDEFDLFKLLARMRLLNNDVIVSQWIGPDIRHADQYIIHIDQTGLGLPTREYFLDAKNVKYVTAYKILIISTAKLLGSLLVDVESDVDDIVFFETKLAECMASTEERRNISDIYLRTDLSSLTLYFPQYDWETYFNIILGTEISLDTPVAVYCVKYLLELVPLLSNTDRRTLQNYIIWRFIRHRLNNLDSRFLDIKQRFHYVLYGREKKPPRWQFCVSEVNTHMGMALGSVFVRQYFDRTSKTDTIQMTEALIKSFENILNENSWLDAVTKTYARRKIEHMDLKIGFPDFILNETDLSTRYYDVEIHPNYFFENVLSILRHLTRVERKRLDTKVNRTLWSTSPAVVNAYYSRNKNQIMFPAGILQPPFYHKFFPKAMNFGGIGVVIGHELTHGFDDKGRLFDEFGNLKMRWKESSIKNFYEKAQCIIDQYSQYVLPELKVPLDGYLTQGENIADNGGLKQSFRAYQLWLQTHPTADETLPDLNISSKQLFFLNFAQVWCGQQRIQEATNRLKTSVHSPGIFRIIGVLSNSREFAETFDCPAESPMNPAKKCDLW